MADTLGTLQELLETLDTNEVAYVFARSNEPDNKHGYESAGLSKGWWYGKSEERRERLNMISLKLKIDTSFKARKVLVEAAEKAAEKLVELMDDRHASIAQRSAVEVLDRTIGKATQKIEQKVDSNQPIVINVTVGDD